MKLKKLLALLAAFGLVAAACGGSSTDGAGDNTSTEETESTEAMADEEEDTTEATEVVAEEPEEAAAEILTDYGVSDGVIRLGINADLSGPFASLVSDIVESQKVYWEVVNEAGGIAGYQIETVVLDSGYVLDTAISNYKELAQESDEGVLMISEQTGTPINLALAEDALDDNMLVIPLSWGSVWPDPELGEAVLEKGTTYCIEAMNGVAWLKAKAEADGKEAKLAIIGRPGGYGDDGSAGAARAADLLGIEVVYDGTSAVAGDDRTAITSAVVESGATIVWTTLTPGETLDIFGSAITQGFEATWSGNSPSFNYFVHLGSDFAADFDQYWYQSGYSAPWATQGIPELDILKAEMTARRPEMKVSDVFVYGWMEGIIVETLIKQAAANGDMTRAGMFVASKEVAVDMRGLGPNQSWNGTYNGDVVRESYIFDVDLATFNPILTSEDDGTGSTGMIIEEGPFVSDIVADYEFNEPCSGV